MTPTPPIPGKKPDSTAAPLIVGLLFIIMGLAITSALFLVPFLQQRAARDWLATDALVTSSHVRTHSGSKGSTYSVAVGYRYRFDGIEYHGDRYEFGDISSSGRAAKQRTVDAYPKGRQITVYVNPAVPSESVVVRDMGSDIYFNLFPLMFSAIGVFIMVSGRRLQTRQAAYATPPQAFTLRPARRVGKLFMPLFIAIFWNGIVTALIVQLVDNWQRGLHSIVMTIFLIPFAAIGLTILGSFIAELLRLANPRILLQPPLRPIKPDEPNTIAFEGVGRIERLTRMDVSLVGSETVHTGPKRRPATREFHRAIVYQLDQPLLMRQGAFRLTIASALLQRQPAIGGTIKWQIEVRGVIPRWPDMVEIFPLIPC